MNVTLTAGTAGQRADQFLAAALDGLTRSAAQKLLEEGRVLRGGKALKKNDRLQPGDVLTLCIPDPSPVEILPQEMPPGRGVRGRGRHRGEQARGAGGPPRPGAPRRHPGQRPALPLRPEPLRHQRPAPAGDRPPDRPGHQRPHHRRQERHGPPGPWPKELQDHSLYREYEAVVVGNFREDQGTISPPSPATPPTGRRWR